MTYNFWRTGVLDHKPVLKSEAPFMVISNVVHPKIVNEKRLVLRRATRRALYVETVDGEGRKQFSVKRINFQFKFHGVEITRM